MFLCRSADNVVACRVAGPPPSLDWAAHLAGPPVSHMCGGRSGASPFNTLSAPLLSRVLDDSTGSSLAVSPFSHVVSDVAALALRWPHPVIVELCGGASAQQELGDDAYFGSCCLEVFLCTSAVLCQSAVYYSLSRALVVRLVARSWVIDVVALLSMGDWVMPDITTCPTSWVHFNEFSRSGAFDGRLASVRSIHDALVESAPASPGSFIDPWIPRAGLSPLCSASPASTDSEGLPWSRLGGTVVIL